MSPDGRISDAVVASSVPRAKSTVREYAEALGVALLLALVIRTFVVQAFKIPSGSMLPTLQIGDQSSSTVPLRPR
jgi:signal peptidase I